MATRGRPKKPATYAEALKTDKKLQQLAEQLDIERSQMHDARQALYTTQYHLRAMFDQRDLIVAAWEDLDDEEGGGRMNYLMDQTMEQMAKLCKKLTSQFEALKLHEEWIDKAAKARAERCRELSAAYPTQCD